MSVPMDIDSEIAAALADDSDGSIRPSHPAHVQVFIPESPEPESPPPRRRLPDLESPPQSATPAPTRANTPQPSPSAAPESMRTPENQSTVPVPPDAPPRPFGPKSPYYSHLRDVITFEGKHVIRVDGLALRDYRNNASNLVFIGRTTEAFLPSAIYEIPPDCPLPSTDANPFVPSRAQLAVHPKLTGCYTTPVSRLSSYNVAHDFSTGLYLFVAENVDGKSALGGTICNILPKEFKPQVNPLGYNGFQRVKAICKSKIAYRLFFQYLSGMIGGGEPGMVECSMGPDTDTRFFSSSLFDHLLSYLNTSAGIRFSKLSLLITDCRKTFFDLSNTTLPVAISNIKSDLIDALNGDDLFMPDPDKVIELLKAPEHPFRENTISTLFEAALPCAYMRVYRTDTWTYSYEVKLPIVGFTALQEDPRYCGVRVGSRMGQPARVLVYAWSGSRIEGPFFMTHFAETNDWAAVRFCKDPRSANYMQCHVLIFEHTYLKKAYGAQTAEVAKLRPHLEKSKVLCKVISRFLKFNHSSNPAVTTSPAFIESELCAFILRSVRRDRRKETRRFHLDIPDNFHTLYKKRKRLLLKLMLWDNGEPYIVTNFGDITKTINWDEDKQEFYSATATERVYCDIIDHDSGEKLTGGKPDPKPSVEPKVKAPKRKADEIKSEEDPSLCKVCYERKRDKVIVLCGHSYCKQCMTEMTKNNARKCPECRRFFAIGDVVSLRLT
jgi:hypothetical protein